MPARPSPRLRALTVILTAALAVNAGLMGAAVADAPAPEPVNAPPAVDTATEPDRHPIARTAAALAESVDLALPDPDPLPADERAPTPAIRNGRLELPAIGVDTTFYEGVTLTAIDRGPSHWPGSAMPGELGNVVVAGHRTTQSRPFLDLDRLERGDELVFTTEEGRFVYEMTRTEIVPFDGTHILEQRYAHTATLFACHPKGSARFRIVGHFRLVDAATSAADGA